MTAALRGMTCLSPTSPDAVNHGASIRAYVAPASSAPETHPHVGMLMATRAVALEAVVRPRRGRRSGCCCRAAWWWRSSRRGSARCRSVCCSTGEASIEAANSSASMPPQARPSVGSAGAGRDTTSRPSRIEGEGRRRGLQRQRRVGAGEAPVGLGRHGAEVGLVEVAVADRPIGLQDDPFDADIGRGGRAARSQPGRVGRGRTGDDQGGGEQGCCRTRQRETSEKRMTGTS